MVSTTARLETWDYVTGTVLMAIATVIGIYHSFSVRKKKQVKEFLVTDTNLSILPLALSIAATFTSAVGLLGYPKETYNNGLSYTVLSLCLILIIPFAITLYLPLLFNLGLSSVFEYLELRFNRKIRLCASIINTVRMMMIASTALYAPALALNQVTGMDIWSSVGTIGSLCIIYTSLGGIKAVVWADVTQYIVMMIVYLVIVIKGTVDIGGIAEVWRIATEGKRTQIIILDQSPYSLYSFWTMAIGGTINFLAVQTTNQYYMQRYLCNRTLKRAKISFIVGSITISIFTCILGMGGLIMYARYHGCDPLKNGQVNSRDQIMPLFAMETLGSYEGLSGVFVAAVMCATLSTLSSVLNGLVSISMEDYIKPCYPLLSESKKIRLSKIVSFAYGVICIALVPVVQNIEGLMQIIFALNGIIMGPVFAVFTVGMALPWVNSWGAISAFLGGLSLTGWAYIGSHVVKRTIPHAPYITTGCDIANTTTTLSPLILNGILGNSSVMGTPLTMKDSEPDVLSIYTLSSLWYASWSLCIGVVISIIVSILTGPRKPRDIDPKLLFPITQRLCSYLPEKYQEFLGYDTGKKIYFQVEITEPDSSYSEHPNVKPSATEIPLTSLEAQEELN